jgi:hypothetical protein
MHFENEVTTKTNQIAVVIYWYENDRLPIISSVQSVKTVPPFILERILVTLPHTITSKVNGIIEKDRWYYLDLRLTSFYHEFDYDVVEFTDVTDHPNEFYRLY